jgi:hypothetical protein
MRNRGENKLAYVKRIMFKNGQMIEGKLLGLKITNLENSEKKLRSFH